MPSLNLAFLLRRAGSGIKKKAGSRFTATASVFKNAGIKTKQALSSSPVITGTALTIGLAGIGGLSYAGYQQSDSDIHIGTEGAGHSSQAGGYPPVMNGPQGAWPPYY